MSGERGLHHKPVSSYERPYLLLTDRQVRDSGQTMHMGTAETDKDELVNSLAPSWNLL